MPLQIIDQCNVKRKTGSYQVVKRSSINTFKNEIGAVKKAIKPGFHIIVKPGFHIIVRVPATVCDYLRRSPAVSRLTCFHIAVRNRKESGTICNSHSVWRNIRKSEWWILYLKFVGSLPHLIGQ